MKLIPGSFPDGSADRAHSGPDDRDAGSVAAAPAETGASATPRQVEVGAVYRHRKGTHYRVEGVAMEATNGRPFERVVIYADANETLYVRTEQEFMEASVDGEPRFSLTSPAPLPPAEPRAQALIAEVDSLLKLDLHPAERLGFEQHRKELQEQLGKEGVGAAPEAGETQSPSAVTGILELAAPGADYLAASLRGQFPLRTEAGAPRATEAVRTSAAVTGRMFRDAPPDAPGIDPDYAPAAAVPEAGALVKLAEQAVQAGIAGACDEVGRQLQYKQICMEAQGAGERRAAIFLDRLRALSSPSADARPPQEWRSPASGQPLPALLRDAARYFAGLGHGHTFIVGDLHAAAAHVETRQPVAPSIPEEPRCLLDCGLPSLHPGPCIPLEEPKAASKEGSKTCEVCERERGHDSIRLPPNYPDLCWRDSTHWMRGYERAEIEKLNAELARMDLALGATKRLVRRLADSEGAAVASSINANTDALSEKQRADAAETEVLRLTKERDEARKIHTDYMKGQEPEERDWAAAFTDSAAAMVLQAFGRIRQPDGSAPTYQSFSEYQSRALDALHKAVVREEPFSAEGRAVLARAIAAEASAKALREATLAILDAAVERSPPVTATNDIEDPGFDYEGHAICMICGEGAGHDEPVVHGDDQPCGKLAALLAPTNPSAEKLTPDPAPLAGESQCPHGFSAGVECPHCQQNRTAPEPLAGQKEGPPRDVSNGPHTYASNDRAEQSNPNQQEP